MGNYVTSWFDDFIKSNASAENLVSTKKSEPPELNLTAKSQNPQPIQGMFPWAASSKKDQNKFGSVPDVAKIPGSPSPVPMPYPTISNDIKSENKTNKKPVNQENFEQGGFKTFSSGMIPKSVMNKFSPQNKIMAKSPTTSNSGVSGLWGSVSGGVKSAFSGITKKAGSMLTSKKSEDSGEFGSPSDYLSGIQNGLLMFKSFAGFQNIKIMSLCAIGQPGCLQGPGISNYIRYSPTLGTKTGSAAKLADAVANGIGSNFDAWRSKVMVPGLPWYPAFTAWPGPIASPLPNIPCPLLSCPSSQLPKITVPGELINAIKSELPADMKTPQVLALINLIGIQAATKFLIWISSQMVTNVLGTGPVPSFAPPFVPVGPVVNGNTLPTLGHLIA